MQIGSVKVGYVRVSDGKQTQALQLDALRRAGCDFICGDQGVSGAVVKRRGLDRVLRELKAGDVLVVWKLDRLGRSMAHLSALLEELRLRSVGFISVTEGIDTTTASGRMLYGLLAVFAEFERAQIGRASCRERV